MTPVRCIGKVRYTAWRAELYLVICSCGLMLLQLYSVKAFANTELITVRSDHMEVNTQSGLHTLSGNVKIVYHDITVTADLVQISRSYGAISRIYAEGSPLRFEQYLSSGEQLRIESGELDYLTRTWTVVLRHDVTMQRQYYRLSASVVEYNLRTKNYMASHNANHAASDTASVAASVAGRVEFTYSATDD